MALTAAQQKELDQLEDEFSSEVTGLSPKEQREMADLESEVQDFDAIREAGAGTTEEHQRGVLGQAIQGPLQFIDTPASAARAGITDVLGQALGKDLAKPGEFEQATGQEGITELGQFPPSAEIFERAGVPEGGRVSDILPFAEPGSDNPFALEKGGTFDITSRGFGGFVSDVATDPVTYIPVVGGIKLLSRGLTAAGEGAGKLIRAVRNTSKGLRRRLTEKELTKVIDDVLPGFEGQLKLEGKVAQQAPTPRAVEGIIEAPPQQAQSISPEILPEQQADGLFDNQFRDVTEEVPTQTTAAETEKLVDDIVDDTIDTPEKKFQFETEKEAFGQKLKRKGKDALDIGVELATNPVKYLTDLGGSKLFKSAFNKVDAILAEKNVGSLGELLNKRKLSGGIGSMSDKLKKLSKDLGDERAAIYDFVNQKGIQIDLNEILGKALDDVDDLAKSGITVNRKKMVEEMENVINTLAENGDQIDIARASNLKTELYDNLPDSAFSDGYKLTSDGKKIQKKMARYFKEAIEDAAEAAEAGLGKRVTDVNADWGTVITAQKPVNRTIRTAAGKSAITQVDALAAVASPAFLAAKQGIKFANTTGFKTRAGRALQTQATAPAIRAGLVGTRDAQQRLINFVEGITSEEE